MLDLIFKWHATLVSVYSLKEVGIDLRNKK